jgi:hypothetical protein
MKALEAFNIQEKGILNIIRAADIYAICLLAKISASELNKEQIDEILKGNKITGYNLLSNHYTEYELNYLKDNGHFREIGQQIIFQTYTMLELYLISKFKEYYLFLTRVEPNKIMHETLKRFSFRNLSDIKRNYDDIIDIHLPSFDVDYIFSDKNCLFQPKDSWGAINIISKARNEIAHQGYSISYPVSTLMDSWYPFEFTRRYIDLFDANFNIFIYKKYETSLIKEYKIRKESLKGGFSTERGKRQTENSI